MARLLLYTSPSRRDRGGVQAVVERLARSARARGHEVVEAWSAGAPGGGRGWSLPLEVTTGAGSRPALGALPRAARSLLRLSRGLVRRRPELVNVHFLSGQVAYFLALRRLFGYRTVLSAHGSDVLFPSAPCRRYLPRFVRSADAVTAVSEDLAAHVRALPGVDPAKVHVIPNGIEDDYWLAGVAERRPLDARPTVAAVGRLERVKGFDVLLRAFAEVHRRVPAARLVLAGEGSRRGELEDLAQREGVRPAVDLPGHLGRDDVRALLDRSAAYVLPSRSEGMPLALLEAMARATPVVATDVGGVGEVVVPGTGLLVAPDDAPALAAVLLGMLGDRDRAERLGRAGRERARWFSSAASDDAYERLYARLLAERRSFSPRVP